MHFPFPEHGNLSEWLPTGMQVLTFTITVKRKATMHFVTESFKKPLKIKKHTIKKNNLNI